MKKLAILFTLLVMSLLPGLLAARPAAAQFFNEVCTPETANATVCVEQRKNQTGRDNSIYGPQGILTKAANIISLVIGVAAIIVILLAGLQLIIGTGDTARIATARDAILYAVVGLIVALLAQAIIRFVVSRI